MAKTITASYSFVISLQEIVDYLKNKHNLQPADIPEYINVSLATESTYSGLSKATAGISVTWIKHVKENPAQSS